MQSLHSTETLQLEQRLRLWQATIKPVCTCLFHRIVKSFAPVDPEMHCVEHSTSHTTIPFHTHLLSGISGAATSLSLQSPSHIRNTSGSASAAGTTMIMLTRHRQGIHGCKFDGFHFCTDRSVNTLPFAQWTYLETNLAPRSDQGCLLLGVVQGRIQSAGFPRESNTERLVAPP